jgi:hypothetical protein
MRRVLGRFSVLWIVLAFFLPAFADGIIIPIPGPEIPSPPLRWLTIVYHHVTVTIQNGVATTRVDQAFRNDGSFPVEGTYVFPLSRRRSDPKILPLGERRARAGRGPPGGGGAPDLP